MRAAVIAQCFVALAAAQAIDFGLVNDAPSVITTAAPATGTAQSVSVQATGAAATAGAQAVQASPIAQRGVSSFEKRDGDCSLNAAGTGPAVHYPDTPQAFLNNYNFKFAAYSAPIPNGYSLNFTNLHASTSTSSYMGFTTLSQYDSKQCASLCTGMTGCVAFNLYFERDSSRNANATYCPNPASVTNIKCVFWGVPISAKTATNDGQYQDSFEVVIAGSNGYNAIPSPSFPGYSGPKAWPGAPSVPNDPSSGLSTYIGSKFFSFGLLFNQVQYFTHEVCIATCSAQTSYNLAHPPTDGKNPAVCNQVVSYMLQDTFGVARGMYCAMFTESWDASYGTVQSAPFMGGAWTVGYAAAYTNETYAAKYSPISKAGFQGGNCGGWGSGTC